MTIMKKALCLILAFCMLSIPVSFAEDTAAQTAAGVSDVAEITEFSDIDYSTPLGIAINTLVEKAVISGFPDGTYKADQTLTRAEFAKIIVCFSNNYTETAQDSGFPDVDNVGGSAHWAKSYIKIARDMGIITGFPDGTFMPDAPVTYEQAVKMIMCALGYTNLSYPDGYIQLAMQKKLFVNSTHTAGQSGAITRGTTAILIYNALSITPNNKTTDGSNIKFTFNDNSSSGGGGGGGGRTEKNSRKITGIVWGTETTMLDTTQGKHYPYEVTISYEEKNGEIIKETLPVASKYLDKLDDYLGTCIRATIKEDDDGKEYISEISEMKNKNRYVSVDIYDFIDYAIIDETGEPTITYYNSSDKKDSLVLSNPEDVYIIYNGKSICTEDAADYQFDSSFLTDTKIGSFKFLSNDGDKKYDIIFIESWKTSVLNGRPASNGIVRLKYGEDDIDVLYSDDAKEKERTVSKIKDSISNSSIEFTALREYDVIDYKETVDKDIFIAEATIAEKSAVSGSFIRFTDDGTVQIKNKSGKKEEYKLNYNYLNYIENYSESDKYVPLEYDNIKLYFNSEKKVAAIEEIISASNYKYGYVTQLLYKNSDPSDEDDEYIDADEIPDESDNVVMMLYQVNPSKSEIGSLTTEPIMVSSTVRVDGVMYKNKPEEVMSRLLTAAELVNKGKSVPKNSSFIRYETNDGQITAIDTVLDETGKALSTKSDDRFNVLFRSPSMIYDENAENGGKHRYYLSSSTNSGFYKASASSNSRIKFKNNSKDSTVVFIPGSNSSSKFYSASKFSYTNYIPGMDYFVEAYNVDNGYGEFLLQYISNGKDIITSYSTMAVVTDTEDEDKDPDSLNIKYYTPSSSGVSTIEIDPESPAAQKHSSLNVGDVILFSTALDKRMYDFYHALDITNLPDKRVDDISLLTCTADISDRRIKGFDIYPDAEKQLPKLEDDAKYRTIYGTASSFDPGSNGTIYVNPMLYTDYFEEIDESLEEEHNLTSSTKLFVYDENEKKVSLKSAKSYLESNINTTEEHGYNNADKVFIYTSTLNSNGVESSNPNVKFVYLIRTKAQANPDNYEGVETPIEDPLAEEKQIAKEELREYISSFDKNDYLMHENLFNSILSDGIAAISEATEEDEIVDALNAAKEKADNVPSDSYIETAKETISDYVDISKYTDAYDIAESAIAEIENAEDKDAIDNIVSDALSDIDAAVISDVISDKKDALDDFVDRFEYDFADDSELANLIDSSKISFDEATSVSELNQLYDDAVAQIEEYVNSNYPKEEESGANSEEE